MDDDMNTIAISNSKAPVQNNKMKNEMLEVAENIKLMCDTYCMTESEKSHLCRAYFLGNVNTGLVPDAFKGKIYDIYVMSVKAEKMKIPLIDCLQGGYFVHGRFGWYAQFMIDRAISSGFFTSINYATGGSLAEGTAWVRAVGRHDGEDFEGTTVSLQMAKDEGWTKNAKYKTMPILMLKKRAASFLIREVCPHIFGETTTAEELEDLASVGKNKTLGESSKEDSKIMEALFQVMELPAE